jgi:hypothetical protein
VHIHLKIHRWVLWWFCVGIVCGIIAVVNILTRDLTRLQDHVILIVGAVHWVLGGVVCWAFDGIRIHEIHEPPHRPEHRGSALPAIQVEWHPASDFVLPGSRKIVLPPRH